MTKLEFGNIEFLEDEFLRDGEIKKHIESHELQQYNLLSLNERKDLQLTMSATIVPFQV